MHPLMARAGRLALYLAAWVPIAVLLASSLAGAAGLPLLRLLLLLIPLCLVYAFICLSTFYTCRILPLDRTGPARLLLTHTGAALIAAGVWALLAALLAGPALGRHGVFFGSAEGRYLVLPVFGAGVLLYLMAVALHYVLLAMEASREARRREQEARALAGMAELRALKAQLNPHFLYNSLNSISALTSEDPAGAREMCVLLGDFLRKTLGLGDKSAIPFREELALARCYLAVEHVRFGARLRVEEAVEESAEAVPVPALMLQPLVENAVRHGIAHLPEGGMIRLEARRTPAGLAVAVENDFDPECRPARRGGVGLANVRKRLETVYGDRGAVEVQASGERFRVSVMVPVDEP